MTDQHALLFYYLHVISLLSVQIVGLGKKNEVGFMKEKNLMIEAPERPRFTIILFSENQIPSVQKTTNLSIHPIY